MFNCVEEWAKFEADREDGRAVLVDGREVNPGLFVREVPDDETFAAKMAARVCPVDAIRILDREEEEVL